MTFRDLISYPFRLFLSLLVVLFLALIVSFLYVVLLPVAFVTDLVWGRDDAMEAWNKLSEVIC